MSQLLTEYFISGFNILLPTVSQDLHIPREAQTWPVNAFSLAVASFLLFFGRLADMYGGFPLYLGGIIWLAVWSLVAGFVPSNLTLSLTRASQGLGTAAYLPSSLMLLGSIYRPGPRKNIIFSVYGACAPLGFFLGIFFAGLCAQYIAWRWYFFIGASLAALTAVAAFWTIPSDIEERRAMGVKMDWPGAGLISIGLTLVVFAITNSANVLKPREAIYMNLILTAGVLCLVVAFYFEGWVAEQPLLPFDFFDTPCIKPLFIALFFQYGVLGNWILYSTLYMTDFMGASPMQLVAWYTPLAVGGFVIATIGGFFLHRIHGTILILIAGVSLLIACLLFAIIPIGASYWIYIFPACLTFTIGIDVTFSLANIFISNSMPSKRQGLAGGLANSLLQLSIALFLGVGGLIAGEETDEQVKQSYKHVFWFAFACAAMALVIIAGFVRLRKANSDYTFDEWLALEKKIRPSE
ncbi:uncharacterized protein PV09_09474 [Verruconis gallopava]|uniref:Major facilitator superfamily (MFS) profile domain-containing protein n=1 Tax=Verruconis gallopava TaxID=253628 RepID=A0A0D1ZWA8_9PEZI|nr:uncharacterized protein PV09_09474 [Verruconis gallopava]KIV98777.1 hypothetical protein PV09_09474 [Verruconis gallopava]